MRGRKPNLLMIKKVIGYKKRKLNNLEIGKLINKDEKQVRRYLKQARTLIPN